MISIRLPDGRKVNVQTDDPQEAARLAHGFSQRHPHPEQSAANNIAGLAGSYMDAVIPGSAEATVGVRDALLNAVQAPFSDKVDFHPLQSFNAGHKRQEAIQREAVQAHPTAAAGLQGYGALSSMFLPGAKVAKGASLKAKVAAGAKTAGAYGALSGALSSQSESILGKAADAVSSGVPSAAVGAVLPLAAKAAEHVTAPFRPLVAPVVRAAGRGLQSLGGVLPGSVGTLLSKEGQQLARDPARAAGNEELASVISGAVHPVTGQAMRLADLAPEVARRQALGVPAVPADLGEGLGRRLGIAARTPGPAVASVRRAIDQRQLNAGSRMSQQVREALGPTANVEEEAQAIRQRAQTAARPHYDEAYAAPGASDEQLVATVQNQSGAMRGAIGHARELALREERDPTTLGFDLDPGTNEVTVNRVPSWETHDLITRGLEGMADNTRDAFGNLNNDGRTILNMVRPYRQRMREVNPAYGRALDAYGGEISGRAALLAGEKSLKSGADDIANVTRGMTPHETENFALGNRSAMANAVSDFSRANPLGSVGGLARQHFGQAGSDTYQALQSVHGHDNIDRLSTVADLEDAAHNTWRSVRGAASHQADLDRDDSRLADAASGAVQAILGHPGAGLGAMAKAIGTGNWAKDATEARVSSVLSQSDLQALRGDVREIGRERARRTLVDQNAAKAVQAGSRFLGGVIGTNLIAPAPDDADF